MLTTNERLKKLNWNWLDTHELYINPSPGDGHCLLHSFLNAFHMHYITGMIDGVPKNRKELVRECRDLMLAWLVENYETVANGNFKSLGDADPFFSLESLQSLLSSSLSLGEEMTSILELVFNKKIYVLDALTKDIWRILKEENDQRDCVIIYYTRDENYLTGHFDMISVKDSKSGIHHSIFHYKEKIIRLLDER